MIADKVEEDARNQIRKMVNELGIPASSAYAIINDYDMWQYITSCGGERNVFFLRMVKKELCNRGWRIKKEGNWHVLRLANNQGKQ